MLQLDVLRTDVSADNRARPVPSSKTKHLWSCHHLALAKEQYSPRTKCPSRTQACHQHARQWQDAVV
jgi:hypothetical protein